MTLAESTVPLSDGEKAMTPGPSCFSQSLRVPGSTCARIVLLVWPLMSGKPSSGLGTSSYFAGGEKFSKGSGVGATVIAGGGIGFGPVRSGRPTWW